MNKIYDVSENLSVDLSKVAKISHYIDNSEKNTGKLYIQMDCAAEHAYYKVPREQFTELLKAWKQYHSAQNVGATIQATPIDYTGKTVRILGHLYTADTCGRASTYSKGSTFRVKQQDGLLLNDGDNNWVHAFDVEILGGLNK
ncbi:hypothetical protein SHAb15599_00105 [Acinetobacter phage SH-Ab 15599]|nr:hypothetical protein SHAb15599_00105 [Acinetobacter phage SH-Ab 15599]